MCHLVWLNQCLRPTCWGYSKIQRFCFAPSSAMEIAWPSCLTMSPLTKGLFWWPSGELSGIWCEVGFPNFFGLTKADSEKQPWQIEATISNRIVLTLGHSPPPKKKRKFPIGYWPPFLDSDTRGLSGSPWAMTDWHSCNLCEQCLPSPSRKF